MAVATPVPCAASIIAFITPRSVGLNHSTISEAVDGSRMAPPMPKLMRSGSSVAMSVVSGASVPADISTPLTRTARLVPSLEDTMPPGMRQSVNARKTSTMRRLTSLLDTLYSSMMRGNRGAAENRLRPMAT